MYSAKMSLKQHCIPVYKLVWYLLFSREGELDFLINIIDRHKKHKNILAIKEHHKDVRGFDFKPVKVEHVENLLHKLDMNKATDYDQIPQNMVKLCSKELSKTLTEIVNNAFKQNTFPDDMKRPEVTPNFKKKMI